MEIWKFKTIWRNCYEWTGVKFIIDTSYREKDVKIKKTEEKRDHAYKREKNGKRLPNKKKLPFCKTS